MKFSNIICRHFSRQCFSRRSFIKPKQPTKNFPAHKTKYTTNQNHLGGLTDEAPQQGSSIRSGTPSAHAAVKRTKFYRLEKTLEGMYSIGGFGMFLLEFSFSPIYKLKKSFFRIFRDFFPYHNRKAQGLPNLFGERFPSRRIDLCFENENGATH